ncbi:MAG: hypothetical protein WBZ20_15035 [Nitrososphaeraceae archaeon]
MQKQHKLPSWGLGKRDIDTKTHRMAYDTQLKNFTAMYDEETIL